MAETTVPTASEKETQPRATREESKYLVPPVDIYEKEDGLVVVADLPGVPKEGVSVRVENGILTIQGKPEHGLPGEEISREFGLVSFFRQFELTDTVDQAKIKAELRNGVLTIHLPKEEKAKPKQVEVKVS